LVGVVTDSEKMKYYFPAQAEWFRKIVLINGMLETKVLGLNFNFDA
jgi:hypothetical protein